MKQEDKDLLLKDLCARLPYGVEVEYTNCNCDGFNYNEALLYRIRNFFAFECNKLPLNPPIYSRKIYKLGFIAPTNFGNSYKLANYKANKFFNKKWDLYVSKPK